MQSRAPYIIARLHDIPFAPLLRIIMGRQSDDMHILITTTTAVRRVAIIKVSHQQED